MIEIKQDEENLKLCEEYTEKKTGLRNVLKCYKFFHNKPILKLYFADDKEQRNVFKITIKSLTNEEKISFNYGDSIKNTEEGKETLKLYDVLTCIKSDFFAESEDFQEFCDSFGYDSDSRKAEKIFKKIQEQNLKLLKVGLTEAEAETFPD